MSPTITALTTLDEARLTTTRRVTYVSGSLVTGFTVINGTTETLLLTLSSSSIKGSAVTPGTTTSSHAGSDSSEATESIPDTTVAGSATSGNREELAVGAKVGIGVGVAVAVIALCLLALFLVHRRRARGSGALTTQHTTQTQYANKGDYEKPELSASSVVKGATYVPYNKAELESQPKGVEKLSLQDTYGKHDELEYEMSNDPIDRTPHMHELARGIETQASLTSNSTSALASTSGAHVAILDDDINTLKAREREVAQQIELDESLQRLKAEQAALQERIRLAEMRRREMIGA